MIPVYMVVKHDPDNGTWGDCFRAAVASVIERPSRDVPHFCEGGEYNPAAKAREWLRTQGLDYIEVNYGAVALEALLEFMASCNPGSYYILTGKSAAGVDHSVVALNGAIVHDPAGRDLSTALVGPGEDDVYSIGFIAAGIGVYRSPAASATLDRMPTIPASPEMDEFLERLDC